MPSARYALNLLIDEYGRLLILKRAPDSRLGSGMWGLPAGKIEAGELPEQAALREMREEIGVGHETELVRYVGPIRDTYYGGQYEIHLFHRTWSRGDVVLNAEHTAYAWVSKEEFHRYPVMDGIDEDLSILDIWPQRYLNAERIPDALKRP